MVFPCQGMAGEAVTTPGTTANLDGVCAATGAAVVALGARAPAALSGLGLLGQLPIAQSGRRRVGRVVGPRVALVLVAQLGAHLFGHLHSAEVRAVTRANGGVEIPSSFPVARIGDARPRASR